MAKIVLVNPTFEPIWVYKKNDLQDPPNVPRALLAIGTYLKQKGHEVKVVDAVIEENANRKIIEAAKDAQYVGFAVMTSSIISSLKISKLIKEHTNAKTVWGGIHPTSLPKQTLQDPLVDFIVHGEGDEAILDLLDGKDFAEIESLGYKKDGKAIINERRKFFDINKIATIDFELVDVEKYIVRTLVQERRKVRMLPVMDSRGCPHRCTFCFHTTTGDQPYRTQETDNVINEVKRLIKEYNVNAIKFATDNFFVNPKRVRAICEGIKGLNIKWVSECRADYFRPGHIDDSLLKLMKESGCAGFTIGGESGSQKILNLYKKDTTPKMVIYAAKKCNEYGFVPSVSFMTGVPGETKKDVNMTVNLIMKLVKVCPIMIGGISPYRPNPTDKLYNYCYDIAGIIPPKTLRQWTLPKYLQLMINMSNIPWNEHSKYMVLANYYAGLYFFTNRRLAMYIKRDPFRGLGFSVFVFLARLRCRTKFFYLPFDRKLFGIAARLVGVDYIKDFSFGKKKKSTKGGHGNIDDIDENAVYN
jgi:anaerobic magnesium-protoporphyrin IX monomethyl ester cyclase